MTEEQKREYDTNVFVKGLNQRKPHFENINRDMPKPVAEATEVEEDMTSRQNSKMNSDRDGSRRSDKNKLGDSLSDEEDTPDGEKESDEKSSGDDDDGEEGDENSPPKKKKKGGKKSSGSKDGKMTPDDMQDEEGSEGEKKSRRATRMEEEAE